MKFSYNWLQSFFRKKLPNPAKLAEILTRQAFEVSGLEKFKGDWILDIDVLPDRASDCFSHLGIARECATLLNWKLDSNPSATLPSFARAPIGNWKLEEDKNLKAKDFVRVEVKNPIASPRYTARVIVDVKVDSSPKWVKEKLEICGLRPINNIVDILNYVMLETGQPLHAFDFDKLSPTNYESKQITNKKILVRKAKEGERIVTLDEEKYDLNGDILVIADEKSPIAIAGIKGGKIPEIDKKTKIVVLESANFNSRVIRRGSKKLDLKTDAALRFEHGIDPNLTEIGINRAAFLIQKIAGGKISQGLIDFYPKKVLPKRIKLDLNYVKSLLGMEIPGKEIKNILKRLEFRIVEVGTQQLLIEIPTFRLDVSIPEDLIEEIGRIYGYQKISSIFPLAALIPPKRNLDIFWEDLIKDILKEAGFSEIYNYSFIDEKNAEIFNYRTSLNPGLAEVENPTSADFKYLRPSLIPNLLKNIEKNQKNFREIKIFELGKIFFKKQKTGSKKQVEEKRMLSGVISGDVFYQAKGVIDLLLNKLGISKVWYDEYQPTPEDSNPPTALPPKAGPSSKLSIWQPKKCAEIKVNHQEIGFLGEISPHILSDLKIESRITIFDIDFEKLSQIASEEHEYQPISRYPAAIRDIAVLVPRLVRVEEVLNKIYDAGGKLIRDVDLFDIYEGEELPEGKKNLAFHIIYQAEDRTLSSKEIDEIQEKIIGVLEKESEWQVRK